MPKRGFMTREEVKIKEIERYRNSTKKKKEKKDRIEKTRQWLLNNHNCLTKELISTYNI